MYKSSVKNESNKKLKSSVTSNQGLSRRQSKYAYNKERHWVLYLYSCLIDVLVSFYILYFFLLLIVEGQSHLRILLFPFGCWAISLFVSFREDEGRPVSVISQLGFTLVKYVVTFVLCISLMLWPQTVHSAEIQHWGH